MEVKKPIVGDDVVSSPLDFGWRGEMVRMREFKPEHIPRTHSLLILSNRGPMTFKETEAGVEATKSVGGLVSAIEPIIKKTGGVWVAWGGRCGPGEGNDDKFNPLITDKEGCRPYHFSEMRLTPEMIESFYRGFANTCLWPLCHGFIERAVFSEQHWQTYVQANQKFTAAAIRAVRRQPLIWVQDYHLALVPQMIKSWNPYYQVSLFWHIPFPSADIFEVLPWAKAILCGMLGSDLIGFHTQNYVNNFLDSVKRVLGVQVDFHNGTVQWGGQEVRVKAAPAGIDCNEFEELAAMDKTRQRANEIRQQAGGEWLLLGVDRLDYTKGIVERLKALETLWENNPSWRKSITFIQIAVPSRTEISGYKRLKSEVEETVGRINGKFTEDYHVPVKYIFRSLSRDELVAHYRAADMALVTPVRDGLNLVAKEYAISKADSEGVLLLSPLAGAASQLPEALMANPYNSSEMAEQIIRGITMPKEEKKLRLLALQNRIRQEDVYWWWEQIVTDWLNDTTRKRRPITMLKSSVDRDGFDINHLTLC